MESKNKLVLGKTDINKQTYVLTIIGILIAAMQVLTGIVEEMPLWQLIVIIVLTIITILLIVSLWIPKIYFSLWMKTKKKLLKGIYSKQPTHLKLEFIELEKHLNFHSHSKADKAYIHVTNFSYWMEYQSDFRFLTVKFEFENKEKILLKLESKVVELTKKGNKLLMEFDYSNSNQISEQIISDKITPYIYGHCQMIFDLKTKKLDQIFFNKDSDVVTLAYANDKSKKVDLN